MKSLRPLIALSALVPAVASALPVFNVWSNKPVSLTTLGTLQTPASVDASVSWNTNTGFVFAYARAKTSAGDTYEFQLLAVTSTQPTDRVYGDWNVSRNGIVVCGKCTGHVSGLNNLPGKPLNVFVDGGNYQMSSTVTNRYDIY